jgi:hypothetical protein
MPRDYPGLDSAGRRVSLSGGSEPRPVLSFQVGKYGCSVDAEPSGESVDGDPVVACGQECCDLSGGQSALYLEVPGWRTPGLGPGEDGSQ